MSLGIAFKGPEGIVLAADSRVTLTAEIRQGKEKSLIPATYDNATKLLQFSGYTDCTDIGVVTYGIGAIGQQEPRTAHSFLPELQKELLKDNGKWNSVEDFAIKFSKFFMERWKNQMPTPYSGVDMVFLIGGFDKGEPYGKVYQANIPSNPTPKEQISGQFGISWGGQLECITRLMKGFDPRLPGLIQSFLGLTDEKRIALQEFLEGNLSTAIPYPFLPLQDCVNLSIYLIRTTMELQNWIVGVRGVGGAIDVATITRTDGYKSVQQKMIVGQKNIL